MASYLHNFPLFAPADENGLVYRGFIQIHGVEHYLELQLANSSIGTSTIIYGSQELQSLFSLQQTSIQARLDQCQDIDVLLSDLKDILEQVCSPKSIQKRAKPSFERYNFLVTELNSIGYDSLESMNDTMDEFVFKCQDAAHRLHRIKVAIPPHYPLQSPTIQIDLPKTDDSSNVGTTSLGVNYSLSTMLENAVHTLNQYQLFFDNMDQLDKEARILDPTQPLRSDNWRRIALGKHCSLQLTIYDPTRPTQQPPMIRFFGNEKKVLPFQQAWQRFLEAKGWQTGLTLMDNLISPLPSIARLNTLRPDGHDNGTKAEDKDDDMACAICYAYKLDLPSDGVPRNQETPDTICPNQQCNRGFHPSCLYEWLRSNPSTTKSFNILFGNCPYCNDKITIKAIL